jgi:hypothetical protein
MFALMERAGFEAVGGTYFNLSSFPLAWILARWESVRGPEDEQALLGELKVPPCLINEGMKRLMDIERGLTRLLGRLPFGVSLACTGRKPFGALSTLPSVILENSASRSPASLALGGATRRAAVAKTLEAASAHGRGCDRPRHGKSQ